MIKREFKINLKSLIIWLSIVLLMLTLVYAVYPYISESANMKSLDDMLEMFPKEVLQAFNMDLFSMSTVFGWLKTEGYVFICLFGGIYSSLLGTSILSIEGKDKTIEFLISKPITRNKIVKSKVICAFIYIFMFNLIVFIFNLIGLLLSKELVFKELLLMSASPLMIYYSLFTISLLLSVLIKNPKKTTFIGLIVTFIPYLFQLVGSISDKVKILKDISIFEFASIRYLLEEGHINYIYLVVSIIIVVGSLLLTNKVYNNKELV